jgi:pSer/pThr/pTyr-binding forkhead associated (FHA) protein
MQRATVFGRLPTNNVVLDHASISRQHAALCFASATTTSSSKTPADAGAAGRASCASAGVETSSSGSGGSTHRCMVLDLGSAHGTWVNGQRCSKVRVQWG